VPMVCISLYEEARNDPHRRSFLGLADDSVGCLVVFVLLKKRHSRVCAIPGRINESTLGRTFRSAHTL